MIVECCKEAVGRAVVEYSSELRFRKAGGAIVMLCSLNVVMKPNGIVVVFGPVV